MDIRYRGFWTEYGWPSKFGNINDEQMRQVNKQDVNPKIIWYLKSGVSVLALRMVVRSKITNELIGSPEAFTDGKYVWTEEYKYYVEIGKLEIDDSFLQHMEKNKFKIPSFISPQILDCIGKNILPGSL